MLTDLYVREKLRELDAERARRALPHPSLTPVPMVGLLARAAGRVLRRVGEGLESWASPTFPESDAARFVAAGQTAGSDFRSMEEGC